MKRIILSALLVILAVGLNAVPGAASSDAPVLLRFNLQPGQVYRQYTSTRQTVSLTMLGHSMDIVQTLDFGISYAVDSVDPDGTIRLTSTYDTIKMRMGGVVAYDSESPEQGDPSTAAIFGSMIGARLRMSISPTGRVLEVAGYDELIDHMTATAAPELRQSLEKQLKEQFNTTNAFGGVDQYPEGAIRVGESWTTQMEVGGSYPMTVWTTYVLRGIQDGRFIIDAKSDIAGQSVVNVSPGTDMKMKLRGTQTGTLEMDAVTGWMVGGRLTQQIGGEMKMTEEDLPQPFTIQTDVIYGSH